MGLKERTFKDQLPGISTSLDSGKTWSSNRGATYQSGKQKTVSESHRRNPITGHYDSGGPFFTALSKVSFPTLSYSGQSVTGTERIKCGLGTPIVGPGSSGEVTFSKPWNSFTQLSSAEMNSKGATAIAQSHPLDPWANTGVALGEIYKDGLPKLPGVSTWKRRTEIAKAAGSEFLNTAFGWLPLVSDVHDTFDSARRFRDLTNKFHSGAGRNEPKRFDFPDTHTSSQVSTYGYRASTELGGGLPFSWMADPETLGTLTRRVDTTTRTWFEGSFTYGIPEGSDIASSTSRIGSYADKLFGLELTPTLMWELTPWSWAVDWFSNAGDVVSNFTAMRGQGLVLRYGYIMSESTEVITYSLDKSGIRGLSSPPPSTVITNITKSRAEANPYGFGVEWKSLSPFQLAVTAALGITHLR